MKVWVLFIFLSGSQPSTDISTYATKAECEKSGEAYRRVACVLVEVPKR